jgi:tetratricopeptide (TPR) repeat protein
MPDRDSIQRLLTEATAHYHSGKYREAIQMWQQVLASEPGNQRATEGIRMASLLLEEAQDAVRANPADSGTPAESSESPENIARVREGIQKVQELLAASRHLEALEACKSLLALAPQSAAVHEILDEARGAYEAQPFINEHLEMARQLFVQERLDEASAELHKIFFLNPYHVEAKKLEGKILALKQKRAPAASLSAAPSAPPEEEKTVQAPVGPMEAPAVDAPTLPAPGEESVLNENWEAELAHLDLRAPASPPAAQAQSKAAPPAEALAEVQGEKLEIVNLSENPGLSALGPETGDSAPAGQAAEPQGRSGRDLDLSGLVADEEPEVMAGGAEAPDGSTGLKPSNESGAVRPSAGASRRGRGGAVMKYALPGLGILIGGGAAWWYFGLQPSSMGGGGNPSSPPQIQATQSTGAPGPRTGPGGRANLGLSSSGSRGSSGTASAGLQVPGQGEALPSTPPPPSPEQTRQEISRHFDEGRFSLERGRYQEAVRSFSRILDLDPANLEAKQQLDEAASKVLEQKRLEEDLQTAKEFFVEKDYESALRKFYRLPRDRNLGDLDLFIRNAWYDWAVVSMKGGNCMEALKRLQEALTVDSNDKEAAKQQEVAEHYRDRPKDRVFYAYVDRLTYRTLNQK